MGRCESAGSARARRSHHLYVSSASSRITSPRRATCNAIFTRRIRESYKGISARMS